MAHLPYTIQTWVGMVIDKGRPFKRAAPSIHNALQPLDEPEEVVNFPKINSFEDYFKYKWSSHPLIANKAIDCLRLSRTPNVHSIRPNTKLDQYSANINACRSKITVVDLKRFIRSKTRLDLEQGAAAVVSTFVNNGRMEDAASLVRELGGILATGYMWIDESAGLHSRETSVLAFAHSCKKLQLWCAKSGTEIDLPETYSDLVQLLLRIRRVAPRDRCLYIPEWMFKEAQIEPPEHMISFFAAQAALEKKELMEGLKGRYFPTLLPTDNTVVLSRGIFRALQRRIFRLFRFCEPDFQLRRDIKKLEEQVLYATDWIEQCVRETEDVAQLAFWFFSLQRRLQKKVVSDFAWTAFLGKGEGKTLYQNNLRVRSTFEETLAQIAGKSEQDSLGTDDDTLKLIDGTCLLMKRYVDVYGQGKKENLVFRPGQRGGSGRGPVDEYNMLCDILTELRGRAKNEGIKKLPGPVHKFLAKDIMAYNDGWKDDAFADRKIPGWELWLLESGIMTRGDGQRPGEMEMKDW